MRRFLRAQLRLGDLLFLPLLVLECEDGPPQTAVTGEVQSHFEISPNPFGSTGSK